MKSLQWIALISLVSPCPWAAAQPVFPGAIGFGAGASAGRGSLSQPALVYKVNSPADPGFSQSEMVSGTLRYGIEHSSMRDKPRVIIFETSGVIDLKKDLIIRPGFGSLTIAGQTAKAPGITLRNGGFIIKAGNVLIQHLAIRPGNFETTAAGYELMDLDNRDCIKVETDTGLTVSNVVVDHVSCSWSSDEGAIEL